MAILQQSSHARAKMQFVLVLSVKMEILQHQDVTHLINHTPSPLLDIQSPLEILFGTVPSYNTLKVFGCLCFAHNQKARRAKFSSCSCKFVFVGYPFGKKGWKFFDLEPTDTTSTCPGGLTIFD